MDRAEIPVEYRPSPASDVSESDSWNDSEVVNFYVCVCCLLSSFLLFVGVYYFTTLKI